MTLIEELKQINTSISEFANQDDLGGFYGLATTDVHRIALAVVQAMQAQLAVIEVELLDAIQFATQ